MSILKSFPSGLTPRAVQVEALRQVEEVWNTSDVIVINLPTGAGKSYIAATIAKWAEGAAIATPTNLLVKQYREDFPKMPGIIGKGNYQCVDPAFSDCKGRGSYHKRIKSKRAHCPGCPYLKDQRSVRARHHRYWPNTYVTNIQLYQTMKLWKPTLIIDEAHNLVPFLQEKHATKVWRHQWNYPRNYWNRPALLEGLKRLKGIGSIVNSMKTPGGSKGLKQLWKELHSVAPTYLISKGQEPYYGEIRDCLKLAPIDIRDMPPLLWPSPVKKIVLMSATLGPKDLELLGLNRRRVAYVETPSPIPAKQRPVVIEPIASLNSRNMDAELPKVAEYILSKLKEHPKDKGIIHVTYAMAAKLKPLLADEGRLLFHQRDNVKDVYAKFRDSAEPVVLVASGLYEGIDLSGDAGRWQVIAKVPWLNLGEPAVKYQAKVDPEWYAWEATKLMLQACGRICRGPDDYGETTIIDATFKRLYDSNRKLFPKWFQESVTEK